jgi:GntR family transcriptional regulator
VTATTISEDLACELKTGPGTPALKVVRRYLDSANETYEASVTIHPADRFTVSLRFQRQLDDSRPS